MLADEAEHLRPVGSLSVGVHLPGEWFTSLYAFIAGVLPSWRDDPERTPQTGETVLTAQLCVRLTSASRHTPGWDFLQFKREEPDENNAGRSIDIAVAPIGSIIWIEGRRYNEYQMLLPIECKRLPTPLGRKRDEREYLHSNYSTTGGIQRFKAGHHGAIHARAAMIGYVQSRKIDDWIAQIDKWIDELSTASVQGWSHAEKLTTVEHDKSSRLAILKSNHVRQNGLTQIEIGHFWIEM